MYNKFSSIGKPLYPEENSAARNKQKKKKKKKNEVVLCTKCSGRNLRVNGVSHKVFVKIDLFLQ